MQPLMSTNCLLCLTLTDRVQWRLLRILKKMFEMAGPFPNAVQKSVLKLVKWRQCHDKSQPSHVPNMTVVRSCTNCPALRLQKNGHCAMLMRLSMLVLKRFVSLHRASKMCGRAIALASMKMNCVRRPNALIQNSCGTNNDAITMQFAESYTDSLL